MAIPKYTHKRETFQTPFSEQKQHIGKKFKILGLSQERTDEEVEGELFDIQFEDGTKIIAWAEEIYSDAGWNPKG